jgi:hypothetical protein
MELLAAAYEVGRSAAFAGSGWIVAIAALMPASES